MSKLRFTKSELRDLRPVAVTFIYYPEDLDGCSSSKLFDFLDNLGFPSCISPLHDQDVFEHEFDVPDEIYDVTPMVPVNDHIFKKPHFHVVIEFGSKKSLQDIYDFLDPIRDNIAVAPFDRGDCPLDRCIVIFNKKNRVKNMRSLLRYFSHLDHPDKVQYDPRDYRCFCGFDFEGKVFSQADTYALANEMQDYIRDNNVYNYADLVDYCRYNNYEWYIILFKSSVEKMIFNYIKSSCFRNTGAQQKLEDRYMSEDNFNVG